MTKRINPDIEPLERSDTGREQGETYDGFGKIVAAALVYPAGGYTPDAEVITVENGATKSIQIELGASCTSIMQPVAIDSFDNLYEVPEISCYTVWGMNHSRILSAKQWRAYGGRVVAKLNDDSTTATLTVTGADFPEYAPFSLSIADEAQSFSTLRLLGRGVAFEKHTIDFATGLDPRIVTNDVGAEVDNVFIASRVAAWDIAANAMRRALGGFQTVSLTVPRLRTEGVDPQRPEEGIGYAAGSRFVYDGQWYRVRSADFGPDTIQLSAEMDTTVGDARRAYADNPLTVDEAKALYEGFTVRDFKTDPLLGGNLG